MFSTLSRRWFNLFATLLLVLVDLLPVSAAPFTTQFSVSVHAECLSCSLVEQFPSLRQPLQGELPWTATTRRFGKRTLRGLAAIASSTTSTQVPEGLKPLEQQAWEAMAKRGQMQIFSPQSYSGSTVVEQGAVRVEVQPLGAQSVKAEQQGKTLVYKNAYPSTDSLQVVKPGKSEEFLYLRNKTAPTVFDYQVKVSKGVQVRSVAGSIAFVDSQGQGVRIERPWLVDSNGQRSESAVHWQVLEGGQRLQLVVEPQGLRYPLVVDPSWTATGSMTVARSGHTATLLPSGKVLVAGGSINSADLYDPQVGTWSNTGSTSTSRRFHTATLLPNGLVLVTGGVNSNNNPLSSAEVYNPSTGTWSATASMNAGRFSHTATLLPNGKVLAVGGLNSNGYLSSAELYDPATGTWSTTASMSTSRVIHTATLLPAGTVLVAGGRDSLAPLSSVELYDPATGTWSTTGSMNTARFSHTATLLPNSKVLAIGGNSESGALSSAELYDPATGTWSTTGSVSAARYSHTATLLPNVGVLVVGGRNSTTRLGSAEIYDSATGTWSATSSLLAVRTLHTATLLNNGKVLVAGGLGDIGDLSISSAELYDPPTTGTWTLTGSMSTARTAQTETLLPNGKVLVAGGSDGNFGVFLGSAELYDPQTGTWTTTGSLSTPRSNHTATLLPNGKVLVAGGTSSNGISSSAELYDTATGTWSTVNSLSTPRRNHTATLLPNGKVLVTGGANNSAELYNPQTSAWSVTGSMNAARSNHTATLLPNGAILVVGGTSTDIFLGSLSSAELYDSQTGTWSTTGSMASARSGHTATFLDSSKVLVVGGTTSIASGVAVSSAELYNPQAGTWSTTGSMATPRAFHTATLLNGKVLSVGGFAGNISFYLSSAELYDPQLGTWNNTGSMSTARFVHTATLLPNGALLVAGGTVGDGSNVSSSAELYGLSAPAITSFSPTSTGVGSIVTVTGSGFTGVTSAKVNGVGASFGYVSDSQLKLQVPTGAASGTITVTTPAGSATSTTSLTVLSNPPTITSFSPTSGPVGTTVIINGANFTGATSVRFRTIEAASFIVLSDSQIQAVVPADARSGAIVVITPNGFNTSPTKFIVTNP
jgi:N-acetylneuraminic acid mutarotase